MKIQKWTWNVAKSSDGYYSGGNLIKIGDKWILHRYQNNIDGNDTDKLEHSFNEIKGKELKNWKKEFGIA